MIYIVKNLIFVSYSVTNNQYYNMNNKTITNYTNNILYFSIISSLNFIILIKLYYGYYIYNVIKLIKIYETQTRSKLIYIKDLNTRPIDRILMLFFKNTIISINNNDLLRQILRENCNKSLSILIKSLGGYIGPSDSMLNLLDIHKPTKTAYVPHYAMSAATLLTLGCDNIYINKYASLGPTDPQITVENEMVSFNALYKLIENKSIDKIKDTILISYYENKILYDDNINLIKKYINKHTKKSASQEDIDKLICKLSTGNIPHHTEITTSCLNKVLNINNNIPKDIDYIYNQLNNIFN